LSPACRLRLQFRGLTEELYYLEKILPKDEDCFTKIKLQGIY
jgi:hypothetical protein